MTMRHPFVLKVYNNCLDKSKNMSGTKLLCTDAGRALSALRQADRDRLFTPIENSSFFPGQTEIILVLWNMFCNRTECPMEFKKVSRTLYPNGKLCVLFIYAVFFYLFVLERLEKRLWLWDFDFFSFWKDFRSILFFWKSACMCTKDHHIKILATDCIY